MARFTCRFCTNPVRTDGAICFACRVEGRSTEPGMPMQEDADDPVHSDLNGVEYEPKSHDQYHGESIRDDI